MQLYGGDGTQRPVPFGEAIERLHDLFDIGWRSQKQQISDLMRAFRYDNEAIREIIRQHAAGGRWPVMRGTQSFYLHSSPEFRIRANLWFPSSHPLAQEPGYREYLSIEKCHNHDFDFFTVNVHGSGYTTRFYRAVDYSKELSTGDHVKLEPTREFRLQSDDVLYVERDLDFHSQLWPDTFSVTVNLIPTRETRYSVQYTVAEESGRIERRIITDAGPQVDDKAAEEQGPVEWKARA